MVPAGNNANRLSSVNYTTKTIHHHHHHHHHHHPSSVQLCAGNANDVSAIEKVDKTIPETWFCYRFINPTFLSNLLLSARLF